MPSRQSKNYKTPARKGLLSPLELLDAPLRAAKETVSGDELEWFSPEGLNPHVYAAGNTAADLLLDPLNLLGGGLYKRGTKMVTDLVGDKAGRGMLTAAADNYIPNYYGPEGDPSPMLESLAVDLFHGTDVKPDDAVQGARHLGSKAMTLLKGAAGAARDLVDPASRALWKGEGIAKSGQNIIKGHNVDKAAGVGSRSEAKAVAEANYQLHNAFQSGRQGPTNPALAAIGERSNLETYSPNAPGTITGWVQKHAGSKLDPTTGKYVPIEMSQTDADFVEKYVNGAWGGSEGIVMKRAASKQSGDHRNDALSMKNPTMGAISRVFKQGPVADVATLRSQLAEQQARRAKDSPDGANFVIEAADDTGVWVRTSKPGSAITEGGVNMLTKIMPSGEHFTVVSDKHDFLEKAPVLGKAVSKYLPQDLIAVTPPMWGHALEKPVKNAAGKKGASPYRLTSSDMPTEAGWARDLETIANLKPREDLLRAEQLRSAGMLAPIVAAGARDKEQ